MLRFILFKHFTNGFVIWSYVLYGFSFIKEIPVIESFRTALWADQVMWIFLLPMFIQNWFLVSTRLKSKNIKFQNSRDSFLLSFVVVGSVGALIFVSFSFFVWDVLSIIPSDFPQTWVHETIDFKTYGILMFIGSHILFGVVIILLKIEENLKKKYSIQEIRLWPKKLEHRVIMMIYSFVIPLIIFVIYNWLLEPMFFI